MIVAKFGGSSLADATRFEKVKSIIQQDPERRYIVPSAPGRRDGGDEKITDLLYRCHALHAQGCDASAAESAIRERYLSIAHTLQLAPARIEQALDRIFSGLSSGASEAYMASRGEYLSGLILAAYLDIPFIDATQVIRFDKDGRFLADETYALLSRALSSVPKAVIPGFYGADKSGRVYTFSRGGSDLTGALVARAVNADFYENWTDVTGFRTADPRIIPDAKFIRDMTYRELRELSYMGASVLHEDVVFPVRDAGIPTVIKNTFDPEHPGTSIGFSKPGAQAPYLTGIAGKKDYALISIEKNNLMALPDAIPQMLSALAALGLPAGHLLTGIDNIGLIVSTRALSVRSDQTMETIQSLLHPDSVSVTEGLALIALVGGGIAQNVGMLSRLTSALFKNGISTTGVLTAPNDLGLLLCIAEHQMEDAIRTVYDAFIRE